jgi:hypothetical protein
MRKYVIAVAILAGLSGSALAFENFIPMGTGYSSDVDSLAQFDSDAADTREKADIYETELYFKGRSEIEADSFFRRFQSDNEIQGGDTFIDY